MRKKIDVFILLVVLGLGAWAALNAQAIGDWWHSRYYVPPAAIIQLANDASMNDKGKQLFFRYSPQLVDQQALDEHCQAEKLGCTEGQSIYILQSANSAEYNRNVVTAAHEMLHIAYSRLKPAEQAALRPLIQTELAKPTAADLLKQLESYAAADYDNEAHSFVGSELPDLSPALEQHYDQYFTDRGKSVAAYNASPERF